jgi:hypothetical protein
MGTCFLDSTAASTYAQGIEKTYAGSSRELLLGALHALTDVPLPESVRAALASWPARKPPE